MWTVAVRPRSEFPPKKRGKFTMERLLPLIYNIELCNGGKRNEIWWKRREAPKQNFRK